MKNIKHLLFIFTSIALLATSCGTNAKTLEPSFANYTVDDMVTKEEFDKATVDKDIELEFANIQYGKTSYSIESSQTLTTQDVYQYEKGTASYKVTEVYNTAKLYNQRNNVILYDTQRNTKKEGPGISSSETIDENLSFQTYNQQIVVADKNSKLYEVIKTADVAKSFGEYVKEDHAISNSYVDDNAGIHETLLSKFELEDIGLFYYVKKKLFTIGITYKEESIPVENNYYEELLTIKAVCQISASKSNVSVNVRYQTTSVKENFSDEYIALHNVDYTKLTTTENFTKVIRLNIGGTVLADTVDVSKYSLGNINYQRKNPINL